MLVDKIKLEPGEQILIQTRRHWITVVAQIASLAFVALLPLPLMAFIEVFIVNSLSLPTDLGDYSAAITYIYSLLLIFVWMTIFSVWTNYYLDVLTITDRRAILVNQKGFFWRNVASFRLERLQDMSVEVNGLIATIFDYGTILVETAGNAEEKFKATHIPHPAKIKSTVLQAADNRINSTPNHSGVDLN